MVAHVTLVRFNNDPKKMEMDTDKNGAVLVRIRKRQNRMKTLAVLLGCIVAKSSHCDGSIILSTGGVSHPELSAQPVSPPVTPVGRLSEFGSRRPAGTMSGHEVCGRQTLGRCQRTQDQCLVGK